MAVFLLSSPSISNHRRFCEECECIKSSYVQKDVRFFAVSFEKSRYGFKLYMIPARTFSHRWMSTASQVGLSKLEAVSHENQGSCSVLTADQLLRSKSHPLDGEESLASELEELFVEVKKLITAGNKDKAVDLLQANYEALKERISAGAGGIEEAAILDVIALGYMAVGDFKFVRSLLDMLNEVTDNIDDDEPHLDSILVHMGGMYSALGRNEKALIQYQRAIGILERTYGKSSSYLVSPLLGMAKVLGIIRKATKAVEVYNRAISILESRRGAESEDLVVPLFGLGNLLIQEGKARDAEIPFIRIQNIYMKLYGENDGRVVMALRSLAHAKCGTGNMEEAIDLYKKALQITKKPNCTAIDENIMEKISTELAELLHTVGRGKEGRELLEECLLFTEKHKGEDHPASVSHLLNLATSYSHSKKFVEAERLLRKVLEIMRRTGGPDDQSITFPMLQLAVALYHLHRDEEAEQLALNVLSIREKAFGRNSLPVGEALDCLASIQTRLGRDDEEVLELLKRVLKIQEKEYGPESEEVMHTLKKIVVYMDKTGRKDEKFLVQKRLSVLRRKYNLMVHY